MSEDLFIRGIISLFTSIAVFLVIDYRNDKEMGWKNDKQKHQKYEPYFSPGLLIGGVLGKLIYGFFTYGSGEAKHMLISLCFELFSHISLYYIVLMLLLPKFRKRINARICAAMWMLPNLFYILLNNSEQLQKPIAIIVLQKNIVEAIFYIWLVGVGAVLLNGIVGHLKFRSKILKTAKTIENEEILELWKEELKNANMRYKDYPLMFSQDVKTPLSIGLFRLTICVLLPEKAYSLEELKLIFRHEIVHIGREDAWNKLTMLFCTAMCWFNPLMWIAMRKSADDLELSCDEMVLLNSDNQTKRVYANLILNTAGDERGFTTCLSATTEALKYRLKSIVKPKMQKSGASTLAVILFVLCMSYGHVSLAYGENTGEEVVYRGKDARLYEINQMYFDKVNERNTMIVECIDTEALHEYIANLKIQNMTGKYSFDDNEKVFRIVYENTNGMKIVELRDDVIRIIAFDEDDRKWRNYHFPEGVDWQYLESILLLDRSSF